MTNNIIQEFIDVIDGMKLDYETSKYPKTVKKIKYNKRRKYILNLIDTITDGKNRVSAKVLCNYAYILATTKPPLGSYKNCTRAVTVKEGIGTSIFEIKITDTDNVVVLVVPTNDDGSICSIEYSYVSDGKNIFSFVQDNKNSLVYFGDYDNDNNEDDSLEFKSMVAKEIAAKNIISDIDSFLRDLLNERGKI